MHAMVRPLLLDERVFHQDFFAKNAARLFLKSRDLLSAMHSRVLIAATRLLPIRSRPISRCSPQLTRTSFAKLVEAMNGSRVRARSA